MPDRLPIDDVLPDIRAALAGSGKAVLIAPPGAGKTTAVAPALLSEEWCDGLIILTSPRRVAARAAAERMAEMLGEKAGETIGYQTRLDSKSSSKTSVLVVTEAIFVNRIVGDPELKGVAAVLFDEAHERHLDSDLGLALALETREVLRDDLRLLVMSATLDGARFADLLGDQSQVVESEGRSHPLEINWLGNAPSKPVEDQVAAAVMTAWAEQAGDILAFLPGVREIERVRERLEAKLPDTPILPLHGQVEPAAQRAAIRRDPDGRRRIVLATAIAETSLTLEGVSVVVDSGLARFAEFDKAAGTSRLVTRAASQAAATQRAGRAARQAPGVAYRLWEEGGHLGRPEFAAPEIAIADLVPLVLMLAKWGNTDPADLAWLDPPSDAAIATARSTLVGMGALDEDGRLTERGQRIASLSLDPVSAATVLAGAEGGVARSAAGLVMLLQERGLGGRTEDLLQRLSRFESEKGRRAETARRMARNWSLMAEKVIGEPRRHLSNPALSLALSRPEMIARRRDQTGETWLSAGGRGYMLDPASPLARAEWVVIGDAQGQAKGARITAGAELSLAEIEEYFSDQIEETPSISWDKSKKRVIARKQNRLGAITLASAPDPNPDPVRLVDILVEKALEGLGELLPASFLARVKFAGLEELEPGELKARAEQWLVPLLSGRRDLDLPKSAYADAILSMLDWPTRQKLEDLAPIHWMSPAGTKHAIDYEDELAPKVEVRAQALFGLDTHPHIGSGSHRTPLTLFLTSPAGRPIGVTAEIAGFWRGAWPDVVKDMKGRYPKHRWPDQPWVEKPSTKTKNAFNRE